MEGFKEIGDLYCHLDSHAQDYAHFGSIGDLFQKCRDLLQSNGREAEAQQAQIELDSFNFWLDEGLLKPTFSGMTQDGKPREYPTIERFDQKAQNYIVARFEAATNPILKARYAHVLWLTTKDYRYAESAIQEYFAAVPLHEASDLAKPLDQHGLNVSESIIAASIIVMSTNSKQVNRVIWRPSGLRSLSTQQAVVITTSYYVLCASY